VHPLVLEPERNGVAVRRRRLATGDVEVEEAAEYLYDHGVVAYPYTTELPVQVLGAKYKWARNAGALSNTSS
jgi:hypothetical protein